MEIKRFIRIFDGFLNDDQNAKFLKFIKSKTSHPGTIITDEHGTLAENDDVRNVEVIGLDLDSDPATSYWFHITKYLTQNLMNNYKGVTGSKYLNPVSIENPQILKYPPGGKYNVHVDYYKTLLQPEDTGHIHTAISFVEDRIRILKGGKPEWPFA